LWQCSDRKIPVKVGAEQYGYCSWTMEFMSGGKQIVFPPFTLDTSNHCLRRGSENISLRAKTLTLLGYLVEHPHRLLEQEELMAAAWPKAKVVGAALRISIQEIRKALGDNAAEPRFIETVGKKGYRFVAPVSLKLPESGKESYVPFVGRAEELERLRHHLEIAQSGKRQVVFVTGEPGIGKTTLVEAFTQSVNERVITALGQCIEEFGSGEAYLPIMELLERMCQLPGCEKIVASLRQYAPSWLAGLATVVGAEERAELSRLSAGAMPEARMREIVNFVEAISRTETVVWVIEDLHWADPSTLALISFLGRRREAARLMVIGTYRQSDIERSAHPLKTVKTELQLHQHCAHLPLRLLPQDAVGEYLTARFDSLVPKPILSTVYRRSEGNPLFMVNVTDYLLGQGTIVRENGTVKLLETVKGEPIPETIRDLIERQVGALSKEDQELLEAGSVAGTTFSVAAIASVLGKGREAAENQYREISHSTPFLHYAGIRRRPNGRGSPRYSFVHALYQNAIQERIAPAKRRRWHQSIGERTEMAYTGTTEAVAAELAAHFESSGDSERAMKYMLQAAQRSFSVCAYAETIDYAITALSHAESLPPTAPLAETKLNLQLLLAVATCASKGYAAEETGFAFDRAEKLSRIVTHDALRFQASPESGLFICCGAHYESLRVVRKTCCLAERMRWPIFLLNAHLTMASAYFYQGRFQSAHYHFERALPYYDFEHHRSNVSLFGWDPGVIVHCYDAQALWFLGFPESADKVAENAVSLAKNLASPFNEALCYAIHATYYCYRQDVTKALEMAEAALKISNDRGFLHWIVLATINKGWSLCSLGKSKEGLPLLLEGLKRWESMGAEMEVPVFQFLLGDICQKRGSWKQALAAVEEGLAVSGRNNDCHYDAELYRLKGELLLRRDRSHNLAEAESCFQRAIKIARKQKTRSLELRAATQLANLWKTAGKNREAYRMLKTIYGRFTEGFDTPDLKKAKALLNELA
jgi:DNA-binding winged helix-turn-helix (wHTH) protein/tetratricopeptide (TPR) repeat protein